MSDGNDYRLALMRRMSFLLTVFLLTLAGFVTTASAQIGQARQIELGGYAGLSRYDRTGLALANEFGAGGRLAYFLSRLISIEAAGDFTETNEGTAIDRINVTRLAALGLFHFRILGLYLGTGFERTYYRGKRTGEESGFTVVFGDRMPFGGRAALRIEGRTSFYPSSSLRGPDQSVVNFAVSAGLSIFTFGGSPRDQDIDGVVDRRDECADTPTGATVDGVGCPSDDDQDSYLNGLDECPDTPRGATVDQRGCPSDSDADTVLDGLDACPDTPTGATVDASGCPSDGDGDGVLDGLDRCPDTPTGATIDEAGCPMDQDSDGVFDGLDQCPDTPPDTRVDARGCSTDEDGDGVLDPVDECPNTPLGTKVDSRGCRIVRDSDGDGVPDPQDRCPGTRAGQQVDGVGCPILFVVEEGRARPLVLQGVSFQSGRSALTTDSYGTLDEVAASLIGHPEVRIEIAGHTDATGSRALNMRLSQARALAVRAYLAQKGVAPDRMEAQGYGPDQPIATNSTVAGRSRNRRVELHLIEGQNP